MRTFPSNNKKIVIKVSTQMITDGVAEIYHDKIKALVKEIAELIHEGYTIIIVSSGAIGCGLAKLGLKIYIEKNLTNTILMWDKFSFLLMTLRILLGELI